MQNIFLKSVDLVIPLRHKFYQKNTVNDFKTPPPVLVPQVPPEVEE